MSTPATTSLECSASVIPANAGIQYNVVIPAKAGIQTPIIPGPRRHPEVRGICFSAVIVVTLLLAGCGRTINRAAERRIRDALPQYIGPARTWRAHVENPPERTLRGKLSQITIDGDGVEFGETIRM